MSAARRPQPPVDPEDDVWPPRRHRPTARPARRRYLLAVGGLLAGAGSAAVLWLLTPGFEDRASGEGWRLVEKHPTDDAPGTFAARRTGGAVELRLVVATDTGGISPCPAPIVRDVEVGDGRIAVEIKWKQRGCGGDRNEEFVLELDEAPSDVWFAPRVERCARWSLRSDLAATDRGEQPVRDDGTCGP